MQVKSIAEQLFFTTVRLDTVAANGDRGSGTGFFFKHKAMGYEYPFIVTNKHVVNGTLEGSITFIERDGDLPILGSGHRLAISSQYWPNRWFGHPSPNIDIAVCAFVPLEDQIKRLAGADIFYRYVETSMIPNDLQTDTLDAVESVTFIGYPNGLWDSANFLPIARRGTTATPIAVDFENTPRFLIDASVFGGSSGSPVFILNQGSYPTKEGNLVAGSRLFFVGVIAAVYFRTQLNQIIEVPIPTQTQPMTQHQEMIDLGVVFKARTVVETIDAFMKANNIQPPANAVQQT